MPVSFAAVPTGIVPGFEGSAQNNRIEFEADRGPPLSRSGSTRTLHLRTFTFVPWTFAEYETFEDWWENTLNGGVEEFTLTDPISKTSATWVVQTGQTYSVRNLTHQLVQLTLPVMRVR